MSESNRKTRLALALPAALCCALLLAAAPAQAQRGQSQAVQAARQAFRGADLQGKDGPFAKMGMDLTQLYYEARQGGAAAQGQLPVRGGLVRIDAVASEDARALRADLDALGLRRGATAGPVVSGWLPVASLAEAAQLGALRFARPSLAAARGRGTRRQLSTQEAPPPVVSQGVQALRAEEARDQFGVDGSGITVGVLSDSFDCLGQAGDDEEVGELPPDVLLTEEPDCASGTDEGRAMVQIVFDVAPGADQRFNTAFGGIAGFVNGICRLGGVGSGDVGDEDVCSDVTDELARPASVIVDDIIYFAEPMFAEGPVAQAVNTVFDEGAAYFSSAGNQGEQSYESEDGFRDSGQTGPSDEGTLHDFDPGSGTDVYQDVTLPVGASVTISFQWDQPYATTSTDSPGSASDVDIYFIDEGGNAVETVDGAGIGGTRNNLGEDPTEVIQFENDGSIDGDGDGTPDTAFRIAIELFDGPAPGLMKYVYSVTPNGEGQGFALNEYDDPHSTLYGHANARGAEAVGASLYFRTPAFGLFPVPVIRPFSALGGTPLLFEEDGTRLAQPNVPMKPEVVGPDGVNNTFFGFDLPDNFTDTGEPIPGEDDDFPNFSGTSAAAPHIAGVAALMRSLNADLTAGRLYQILEDTAIDMDPIRNGQFDEEFAGFDFKTGYGLVDAVEALGEVPNAIQFDNVNVAEGGEQVEFTITVEEPGAAERFVIARCFGTRSECGASGDDFEEVRVIEAMGEGTFTFAADVNNPGTYTFLVRQVNSDGTQNVRTVQVEVGLPEGDDIFLTEAFPTPFQARTTLRLIVSEGASVDVTATLYDALGRQVRTFFEGEVEGQETISLDAGSLSSGVYFIRVEGEDFLETRSVVLVR